MKSCWLLPFLSWPSSLGCLTPREFSGIPSVGHQVPCCHFLQGFSVSRCGVTWGLAPCLPSRLGTWPAFTFRKPYGTHHSSWNRGVLGSRGQTEVMPSLVPELREGWAQPSATEASRSGLGPRTEEERRGCPRGSCCTQREGRLAPGKSACWSLRGGGEGGSGRGPRERAGLRWVSTRGVGGMATESSVLLLPLNPWC